jgi:hypothetical protein
LPVRRDFLRETDAYPVFGFMKRGKDDAYKLLFEEYIKEKFDRKNHVK